jgi:hypothetical protein
MKKQGQIAIITLFSLTIFAVIGGSIVTQVVYEQKNSILQEKSRQAYYAAESGIESALQEVVENGKVDIETLDVGTAGVKISSATQEGGATYVVPGPLHAGSSYYLNLDGYSSGTNQIRICWDKADTGMIISYFYESGGSLLANTYAYNSLGSSNLTNATASISGNNQCGLLGQTYYANLTLPVGTPKYLLVWVAYQDNVEVGFQGLGGGTIEEQGTIITSTANVSESDDQIARQLKYAVSRTAANEYLYPPAWLTVPVYAGGEVTYTTH